ncbi:hypothetical protein Cadr_000002320 [Camelus dromedarius]|uniref:Uncharacterized protein n=1 Tax=Camelus dromedarius TaxID=9838 RepID=A0A5N4EGW8_CAMDR|nr:hypothetical protein Cadr_000002320 [Camelus dromedarius]
MIVCFESREQPANIERGFLPGGGESRHRQQGPAATLWTCSCMRTTHASRWCGSQALSVPKTYTPTEVTCGSLTWSSKGPVAIRVLRTQNQQRERERERAARRLANPKSAGQAATWRDMEVVILGDINTASRPWRQQGVANPGESGLQGGGPRLCTHQACESYLGKSLNFSGPHELPLTAPSPGCPAAQLSCS